jgi:dolichol-phosphate mannosyltransferase
MKTLVILPTYNEKENIRQILPAIWAATPHVEILIVDDNSPDGTGQIVKELQGKESRLHLLSRAGKEGLGKAYIAGFKWAIDRGYEAIVQMDADFSHRPQDLKVMLEQLPAYDFVHGSRWVPGGNAENWSLSRKIISRGGSFYARMILGYPIRDWTGGFIAWKRHVLEKIGLDSLRSNGYSFQIELKYRAKRLGFNNSEYPITFEDRRFGESKMSSKIVFEALYRVWGLRQS